MEKITAALRATSQKVISFGYIPKGMLGEAVELKTSGYWVHDSGDKFPVSLHVVLPPGHPICPFLGDEITITVERSK